MFNRINLLDISSWFIFIYFNEFNHVRLNTGDSRTALRPTVHCTMIILIPASFTTPAAAAAAAPSFLILLLLFSVQVVSHEYNTHLPRPWRRKFNNSCILSTISVLTLMAVVVEFQIRSSSKIDPPILPSTRLRTTEKKSASDGITLEIDCVLSSAA